MSASGRRSLNSITSSCLGCSITGLYRRILSLGKTLGVLASRRITIVVARRHVGRKRKKARVQDVKAKRNAQPLEEDWTHLQNESKI